MIQAWQYQYIVVYLLLWARMFTHEEHHKGVRPSLNSHAIKLSLRGLPNKEWFQHYDLSAWALGLGLARATTVISVPKAVFRASQDCKVYSLLTQCMYQNTITIHTSSSPPVTSMYTCLSEDIMWRQRCEPTTLAKHSALNFVYKTVHVTGLVWESEQLFLVSI